MSFFEKDPDAYQKLAATLQDLQAERDKAEEDWLELEILREAIETGS